VSQARSPRVGIADALPTSAMVPRAPVSTASSSHCTSPSTTWPIPDRPAAAQGISDAELVCLAVVEALLDASSERQWPPLVSSRIGHLAPISAATASGCASSRRPPARCFAMSSWHRSWCVTECQCWTPHRCHARRRGRRSNATSWRATPDTGTAVAPPLVGVRLHILSTPYELARPRARTRERRRTRRAQRPAWARRSWRPPAAIRVHTRRAPSSNPVQLATTRRRLIAYAIKRTMKSIYVDQRDSTSSAEGSIEDRQRPW
jgi:hypothetical protein